MAEAKVQGSKWNFRFGGSAQRALVIPRKQLLVATHVAKCKAGKATFCLQNAVHVARNLQVSVPCLGSKCLGEFSYRWFQPPVTSPVATFAFCGGVGAKLGAKISR